MNWTPSSWRKRPAMQMPTYADPVALGSVETMLASAPPLTTAADNLELSNAMAEVAEGRAFLLQGGDCAETFAEFGADRVRLSFNLILHMAALIRASSGQPVVKVARMAGQFAKPRSSPTETIGTLTLPVYRGDIVNGPDFDAVSRTPDPMRMLEAHRQSKVTVDLMRAYSAAAYADISEFHRSARKRLGLPFEHAATEGDLRKPVQMFTSHEALLLNYEQSMTHWDDATEAWWALSGNMLWIGDRTRKPDGAHVEYMRGIKNTIGLKCGPSLEPDELLKLIEILDPENRPGRLVLIGRFGASKVAEYLPALMRATRKAGVKAIWSVDPMHGNTVTAAGKKTRLVGDIVSEIDTFFDVAEAEGVRAGGVHLEMTGADVTECLGGSTPLLEDDLSTRYLTHCDPRLNQAQALDVADEVARIILKKQAAKRTSHAA